MNKQSFSTNSLSKLRYEVLVDDYVPQPQLATCMWTITSPSIVQMHGFKFGTQGCTITCQMMSAPCAVPICFEIFKKIMQELKFRVPFF